MSNAGNRISYHTNQHKIHLCKFTYITRHWGQKTDYIDKNPLKDIICQISLQPYNMKVLLYSSNSLVVKYIHPVIIGLVLGWVVRVIIEYIHAVTIYHPGNINFSVMSSKYGIKL